MNKPREVLLEGSTFLFHVLSLARFGPFSHSFTKHGHELAVTEAWSELSATMLNYSKI